MAMKPKALAALAGLAIVAVGLTAGSLFAAESDQPAPAKPVAVLDIVAVPANAADPNAITALLSNGTTKVAMPTSGLNNVSVGVPVTLKGSATDPKLGIDKYAWTLTGPKGSEAKLSTNNEPVVKFTPDLSGIYKVDVVLTNAAGASPMASTQIRAGEYIGVEAGNCVQCHEAKVKEWEETGHGVIFHREINGGAEPAISHYNEGCVRCHTTGYAIGSNNGGFADVQAKTGWQFPPLEEIQKGDGETWNAIPADLKLMGNIQCEDCHGPAKAHVENGAKMATSIDNGVCNQCHNGGGHHIKGTEITFAKHSDETSQAWTYPTGPSRQACVRCHSGAGYISFTKAPTEMASWDNSAAATGCTTCHDPHSDANKFQLRITGKPVEAVGITKDYGLSATCVECHNARTTAADAQKASFPHYSAAGEMMSDMGGVTYGQTVPNSPHGLIVGTAPVKNPDEAAAAETPFLFGGAVPGSCVTCHMLPNKLDAKDSNKLAVGEHSFNMASPDGNAENTAACQGCHAGAANFEFQAKADYDGNGAAESVQAEVAGSLKVLQTAIGNSGVKPIVGHPYFDAADVAKANEKQKNAIYNYLFVRGLEGSDGQANAVHNFKRSIALVQLSYKDLTGSDMPGSTLIK